MDTHTDLVRLVYASRANLAAGLNADVARILMQSRRNNPPRGLVGALYFSDGCFFQCLEGPAAEVDALYARLGLDDRHRDLMVLSRERIAQPSFASWSMKFVPNARVVGQLLARHGLAGFDPYRFTPALLRDMVALLLSGSDAGPGASADGSPRTPVNPALTVARRAQWIAVLALLVAVAALGTSVLSNIA